MIEAEKEEKVDQNKLFILVYMYELMEDQVIEIDINIKYLLIDIKDIIPTIVLVEVNKIVTEVEDLKED